MPLAKKDPLESVTLEVGLTGEDWPPLRRTVFVHNPEIDTRWVTLGDSRFRVDVAENGSVARLWRGETLAAVIGPLVQVDHAMPELTVAESGQGHVTLAGGGVTIALTLRQADSDGVLTMDLESDKPVEGPVLRAPGAMQQAVLPGLEYLSAGERSSSKIDCRTDDHRRYAPDPMLVTWPWLGVVTDRASVSLAWDDTSLRPVFATPNFFDGTNDTRMGLRGRTIRATIRVASPRPIERMMLEGVSRCSPRGVSRCSPRGVGRCSPREVARRGLPPLPTPPRTVDEQWALCLDALDGPPLKTADGWGHCAEPRWDRRWFAPMASTVWRLTGTMPEVPRLVPGGAHVDNDASFFVTGRAEEWLAIQRHRARALINQQKPDGSFRYTGKYREGHFEDTALGICATPAARLLDVAWRTGDDEALSAGLKTVQYMRRFSVPRGAQTWEVPLHTPDLLASARAVHACVRAYQLTGDEPYLDDARRWAATGLPFVYLWGNKPVMVYGTPPVFGATNWVGPVWFGLPVQWVGGVYAYSLAMLAPHDDSFPWEKLARGILIAAEQMQYPTTPENPDDARWVGLLPDAFELSRQERRPWRINPCALVSLRLKLDGRLDALSTATDGHHRVTAPYPVAIENGQAIVDARAGTTYQVIVDGERVIDVRSNGRDVVPLE
jgi:hypothetical protein